MKNAQSLVTITIYEKSILHSDFDLVQFLILILVNSAALTLLVVFSQQFEDTAKKLTVVKNSL